MTPSPRLPFHFVVVTAALAFSAGLASGQGLRPVDSQTLPRPVTSPGSTSLSPMLARTSPSLPVSAPAPAYSAPARSMLDQPASEARVQVNGDRLTVTATNASLSEVIRQVAAQTGMQVEGNSHDERVFGIYGPGNPLEVISSLLYDSGYNVMMVGSTPDGAPRRLLLSPRTAGSANAGAAAPSHNGDEEEEAEQPQEPLPPQIVPQPVNQGGAPAAPAAPGAIKTPQQMLEELQKMHLGQQPQEMPRE